MYVKENEFVQMREELAEFVWSKYMLVCINEMKDLCRMIEGLKNGTNSVNDVDEFFERSGDEEEQQFKNFKLMLKQIYVMDDGDIKQLYYKTFGRWHPVQNE